MHHDNQFPILQVFLEKFMVLERSSYSHVQTNYRSKQLSPKKRNGPSEIQKKFNKNEKKKTLEMGLTCCCMR